MPIRLLRHEAVPKCGSYEIRFPDGRPSRFIYWDDTRKRSPPKRGCLDLDALLAISQRARCPSRGSAAAAATAIGVCWLGMDGHLDADRNA
jgi:hypothetical protein